MSGPDQRTSGASAADLIDDPELRKQITIEADQRVRRSVAVRWTGHLAFFLVFSIAFWTLTSFAGGFSSAGWGWILILAVCVGIAGGLLELVLQRFWRRRYERQLWRVIAERGIPICVHCGYSLAGTVEPRCPECGAAAASVRK